jgi:hypothetical protein
MLDYPQNEAAKIAQSIENQIGHLHSGTLRIFGDWFGRPMDNLHTIISARSERDIVIVLFDLGEELQVWDPEGFDISASAFRIDQATRVVWKWFSYGSNQRPEDLHIRDYDWDQTGILRSEDGGVSIRLDTEPTRSLDRKLAIGP